jgi:multidrug resistance protein
MYRREENLTGLTRQFRVFAPASEIIGRRHVLNASNVMFLLCIVACALSNSLPMLLVFRFLAGCAGAAPLAVAGGTIADMVEREQRGRYFGVFVIGAQLAPVIGPIMGGFLCDDQALGWRWTFWVVAIWASILWLYLGGKATDFYDSKAV